MGSKRAKMSEHDRQRMRVDTMRTLGARDCGEWESAVGEAMAMAAVENGRRELLLGPDAEAPDQLKPGTRVVSTEMVAIHHLAVLATEAAIADLRAQAAYLEEEVEMLRPPGRGRLE